MFLDVMIAVAAAAVALFYNLRAETFLKKNFSVALIASIWARTSLVIREGMSLNEYLPPPPPRSRHA